MAMDEFPAVAWASANWASSILKEGQAFLGFTVLSELAQRSEYRRMSETIARDMTRKWIKLQAKGEGDKSERIKKLEDAMSRYDLKGIFQKVAEQDGYFGRGHIYVDLGTGNDPTELATPIGNGRNDASRNKVAKGSLRGFKAIEAMWVYPQDYNTSDPLSPNWYKPGSWIVNGKRVHASRLLTIVGREVPDILKPAYSFGGLSMSQIARPYVDNWLQVRQAVANIVTKFSTNVLKTNLAEKMTLTGVDQSLFTRIDFFNEFRTNDGLLLLDTAEEFENVAAPLSGLDAIQAQVQQHMAAVSGIPIVILLGIQPAGLNASSQGEIDTYHKWIHSWQERLFRPDLEKALDFIQLSEFGDVDPDITFKFEQLGELTEKEVAEVENIRAQTDVLYEENGILDVTEIRKRIANDEESPYQGLDVDDVPLPPPGESDDLDEVPEPDLTQREKVEAA